MEHSEEYKLFKSWVPAQKISLGGLSEKVWKYYDFGPKDVAPLILIPGVSGTGEIFYKQMVSLCPKGFRLIAIHYAPYESLIGFCKGFDRFLDKLGLEKVHLLGTALGGYLAQCYYQTRPSRVLSLILNNSFCDTQYFHDNASCAAIFSLMPEFMLKRIVLNNFPQGEVEPDVAEAIDFMVQQLETLNQSELSSRLNLNCALGMLNPSGGLMSNITIIDTLDSTTIPERLREEVYKFYPNAKIAYLKSGGDVAYLSKASEMNVHIQVHLRNFGLDPLKEDGKDDDDEEGEEEEKEDNKNKEVNDGESPTRSKEQNTATTSTTSSSTSPTTNNINNNQPPPPVQERKSLFNDTHLNDDGELEEDEDEELYQSIFKNAKTLSNNNNNNNGTYNNKESIFESADHHE
ncbi:alpha/beta hydrolase fold-1 domain-containing protein [Cavenderia fasciculata]|uniref:Maspardin n=1 Tax=Cavenderia fasciculata TaxID=261658 RepID=F4QF98_CACFS|nr:alpha/beta hydrolase fold-1 domain-containing protein [Cavenderia fasciculata]EGG13405.1 alpha/beta hydrolase fold-1 domain-containing protein [Cavenderia fasciculata]|eukprot:XP_004350109.1 alpha/beta hydrolase fold-1 domain-containing protein [Cavenderia fasciculata]